MYKGISIIRERAYLPHPHEAGQANLDLDLPCFAPVTPGAAHNLFFSIHCMAPIRAISARH
jgi:hypothetical protein